MWRAVFLSLVVCGLGGLVFVVKSPADPPAAAPVAKISAAKAAATPVKMAASRVIAVTVYPNSALVTREVEVPEGRGVLEVAVTPLPPTTVNSSLYTEGTDGIRVLATRFRTRQLMEDTREEVRKAEAQLNQLQQNQERLESDIKAIQSNLQLLTKLENYTTVTTTHANEKGVLNSDSAINLSKYIMESRVEKSKEIVGLQQQVKTNQEQTEFARRKLHELASGARRSEQDAVIVVDKVNDAAGKVRLNYLVDAASWRPQYKLRAGKAVKDAVQLEYLAALVQHTGEDWANVNLVLSTAQPTLNAAPPDLQVLNVTTLARGASPHAGHPDIQEQARTLRSQAQKDFNEKKQSSGVGLFNSAAALDQSWELLNPDAAVRRGCTFATREGPSVTYHLNTRLTVPSRNDEQIIEVARIDMAPEYYYKAVPILTSHVYRLADLTNRSNYVLLPGEATMYIGSDFVGQMNLPMVAIGEQFTAGFGVDPQLQVQRAMIDRSRSTQGGNQVLRYEFRVLVNSYKADRVKLQVWDRLPHAENDSVGVSLVKTAPEISKDALYQREQRPSNLLRWDVSVEPGMNGEKALAINYEFKLDLDRQMMLGSFQSASAVTHLTEPRPLNAIPAPAAVKPTADAKVKAALAKLSPEDRQLAEAQIFCAIDQESPLGSMGPILKVMVKGRPVFVCCRGCETEVKSNPDQAITMLDKLMNRVKTSKK